MLPYRSATLVNVLWHEVAESFVVALYLAKVTKHSDMVYRDSVAKFTVLLARKQYFQVLLRSIESSD